ncbi:hypothetical protein D3C86_2219000 [compost metagenome]
MNPSILGASASAIPARASFVTCEPAQTSAMTSPAILHVAAMPMFAGTDRMDHAVVNARV